MVRSCSKSTRHHHGLFLKTFIASRKVKRKSSNSLFAFKPLHNLSLGISTFLKECTVHYMSADRLRTGRAWKGTKAFVKIRARIIRGWNLLLSASECNWEVPGTPIDFLSGLKWIWRRTYKAWAPQYARREVLPNVRQSVSFCSSVHWLTVVRIKWSQHLSQGYISASEIVTTMSGDVAQ